MKKQLFNNRRTKYSVMSMILSVLLVTVTVMCNALVGTLAKRYAWYGNMNPDASYQISENCYTLLGSVLADNAGTVEIIFCDPEENWLAEPMQRYVYESALQLRDRFAGRIQVSCHDIWLNPYAVRNDKTGMNYAKTLNAATGDYVDTVIKSTSVIIVNNETHYSRVYSLQEFFVFKDGDASKVWAYNGEKKLAAGVLHAIAGENKVACLTNNHGEAYFDYELVYLLDDAGYQISFLDLYKNDIPDNCTLLVCFNPNSDFAEKQAGVSDHSESEKLEAFLAKSGNSLLLFLENGTPALPNMEAFLKNWGVTTQYDNSSEYGISYRYMVQDSSQSLTSDGYTIYGEVSDNDYAKTLIGKNGDRVVFKNATALNVASDFGKLGNGSYQKENRTLYSIFESGSTSSAWTNGKPRAGGPFLLMTLTEQTNADNGSSFVCVSASAKLAVEDQLQSAVYGNTDALLQVMNRFGMQYSPIGLSFKPFQSTDISLITTVQMWRWTLLLALIPAVVCTALGIVILVKRKNA